MELKRIQDTDVSGKRVLLRTSLNVPVGERGELNDVFRLKRGLPTLQHLAAQGARTVIVGYFGRRSASLRPVADALMRLAPDLPIRFSDAPLAEVSQESERLSSGECVILENIRREEGEEKNDPALVQLLASAADLFVGDAFAEAHRAYASNVGVANLLPSYAGLLMQDEVSHLSAALKPPQGALAIIGGAKFETKEPLIKKLLPLYATVCVGGALSNDFLRARGQSVGSSKVSDARVPQELAHEPRILVQEDMLVASAGGVREVSADTIHADERVVDAGCKTAALWSEMIQRAPFVLWNGPLGIYEEGYVKATDALAEALVRSSGRAAVGGGDTIAALERFAFDEERIFRSTGGGAMLEFLADGTLPGLEPLRAAL